MKNMYRGVDPNKIVKKSLSKHLDSEKTRLFPQPVKALEVLVLYVQAKESA